MAADCGAAAGEFVTSGGGGGASPLAASVRVLEASDALEIMSATKNRASHVKRKRIVTSRGDIARETRGPGGLVAASGSTAAPVVPPVAATGVAACRSAARRAVEAVSIWANQAMDE